MRGLVLASEADPLREVVVIGAHSDDIEIGAGGTVRAILEAFPDIKIHWVVLAAAGDREREARGSAMEILGDVERHAVTTLQFRDGFFPYEGAGIKDAFENFKRNMSPDLVITHYREDLHQDHRLVGELTWNTFRDHLILEYEIPKYDGGLGSPNVFVPIPGPLASAKIDGLLRHFGSQRNKGWFDEETFRGLMRLRGIECRSPTGYAEAFYARKALLTSFLRY